MVVCMLDARCVIVRVAAAVIEARLSDVNLCGWQNRVKQIFYLLASSGANSYYVVMTTTNTKKATMHRPAAKVAESIGVHKSTVNRIADRHDIGTWVGYQRIFTIRDEQKIKRLCKFSRGNPNFVKKTR